MKKNILFVMNSLKLGGGAEKIAAELGSQLYKKNYKVYFLARYDAEEDYDFQGDYRYLYETRNKNELIKTVREINTAKKISKICKEKNISSVISFSALPNHCSILSKLFFGNTSNIIISVRNNPLEYYSNLNLLLAKKLYPKADRVVVQTKRMESILKNNFSTRDTVVIPNFVNLAKYKDLSNEEIDEDHKKIFSDNIFKFITVGRLAQQKGQCHLIRCFKEVQSQKKDCKLIILGEGALEDKLKNLTRKMNIEEKVLFLGKVPNVFPYLKKVDCFTLSSFYEGFPNVLLEALSQNLPIISTDCLTGPREILCPNLKSEVKLTYPYYGKYGILTDSFKKKFEFRTLEEKRLSKNEKIFSKAIIEFLENKNLREKYLNQQKRVKDFDIGKIIKKWKDIL